MDVEKLLKTKAFLDEMAISIRNIIYSTFPGTSPEEREDIEQDVKLKIWRSAARGKNFTNLRSYLWKVVYTTALDVIGRRMESLGDREIEAISDSVRAAGMDGADPEILWRREEIRANLRKAVGALPDRRRTVMKLWLLDMNLGEISRSLGWGENQVRHLLYRGLEDLKEMAAKETE
jgi:RNA polymerase sigma factor (sigma-70 family)